MNIVGVLLGALILTWLPGIIVGISGGVRGINLWGIAPAITFASVAFGSLASDFLGFHWGILWIIFAVTILSLFSFILKKLIHRRGFDEGVEVSPWSSRQKILISITVGLSILVSFSLYLFLSKGFTIIPQDYDHVFQANAIRYVSESGDSSPQGLRAINDYMSTASFYYPSAWHSLASLLVPLSEGNILQVVHASVALWFFAIPVGVVSMTRTLRLPAGVAIPAIAVSSVFSNFPWELIWRGVFPFTASLVFLLPVLAIFVDGMIRRSFISGFLFGISIFGLVSIHTSAAVSFAVYALPATGWAFYTYRKKWKSMALWLGSVGGFVAIMLLPVYFSLNEVTAVSTGVNWPAIKGKMDSIPYVLGFIGAYRELDWINFGFLAIPGLFLAFRKRYYWAGMLSVSTLVSMGLFLLAVSFDNSISEKLTQWWWNDHLRIGALATLAAPIFVGIASYEAYRSMVFILNRIRGRNKSISIYSSYTLVGLIAFLIMAIAADSLSESRWYVLAKYQEGPTVYNEEVAAYDFIAEQSPQGRVMNDPADGSAWMYALSGVKPVYGQFTVPGGSPDQMLLYKSFDSLESNKKVEKIVKKMNIEYVVVGKGFVFSGMEPAPGLTHLKNYPDTFEKVYENDKATVYRVKIP